jgi:hypothetical protein
MRGDADSAGDLFAPVEIFEEMLAEALACHGWNSVARGASSRRNVGTLERLHVATSASRHGDEVKVFLEDFGERDPIPPDICKDVRGKELRVGPFVSV